MYNINDAKKKFEEFLDDNEILINEKLSKHTTYKVGGDCDIFLKPSTMIKIRKCFKVIKDENMPFEIFGRGSNIIASDDGFRGVIVCLTDNYSDIEVDKENKLVTAEAGASIIAVSVKAMQNGLSGMEFICGVPGSVGGAVAMNAGCYGKEMKDVIKSVTVLKENGDVVSLDREEIRMEYRHTEFQDNKDIILSATFALEEKDSKEIKDRMDYLNERRKKVQPLGYPNAGSVFKRPGENQYPGKIIEDAGLKGYVQGGAQISDMHANFIINKGNAKASDILELIDIIKKKVKETMNIDLVLEQKIVGKY